MERASNPIGSWIVRNRQKEILKLIKRNNIYTYPGWVYCLFTWKTGTIDWIEHSVFNIYQSLLFKMSRQLAITYNNSERVFEFSEKNSRQEAFTSTQEYPKHHFAYAQYRLHTAGEKFHSRKLFKRPKNKFSHYHSNAKTWRLNSLITY